MTITSPIVAVIGAGNVGCALAGDLVLRGFDVRLFNRSPERVEPIRRAGGITLTGAVEGFARIDCIGENLAAAVRGADVVVVTVPSAALPRYAAALVEATTEAQILWLNPGHTGGALYLAAEFARRTSARGPLICQLSTASHGSRMAGSATVKVLKLMRAALAAFPAARLREAYQCIDSLLPGQFSTLDTVLQADLLNMNAILHPPGMVCNTGWIEATGGDFRFYGEGNGPSVSRVIAAVDRERLALAARLGVPTVPFVELFHQAGLTPAKAIRTGNVHEAIRASAPIQGIKAPDTVDHRYLHEDVGWGLVPWIHLAQAAGTSASTMRALTQLASVISGIDYLVEGLTPERMGIDGMGAAEIQAYVGA